MVQKSEKIPEKLTVYFDSYRDMCRCIESLKMFACQYDGISAYYFCRKVFSNFGMITDGNRDFIYFWNEHPWLLMAKHYSIDDIYNIKINQVYNGWVFDMPFSN